MNSYRDGSQRLQFIGWRRCQELLRSSGGDVGWGEVINGGFGMVLDGTADAERRAKAMLSWDVSNGLARRAWAGNDGAVYTAGRAMEAEPVMAVTLPAAADEKLVAEAVEKAFGDSK